MRALALLMALAWTVTMTGCASRPPVQTVMLGTSRIAYQQAGAGRPTVVFQSGLGDGKDVWAGVIPRVASSMAVFAYDRPGYGDSSAVSASPRDACSIARELHATLHAAAVTPPYVLVGHSIGGLYQYAFAKLYPTEVAAVLLVDPTHPDHWARMQREAPAAARIAVGLRATVFSAAMRAEFDAQALATCTDELKARQATSMPVHLLVRSEFSLAERGAFETLVRGLEAQWSELMPAIVRRRVEGAGHYIQKDRPDVVADELRALVGLLPGQPP